MPQNECNNSYKPIDMYMVNSYIKSNENFTTSSEAVKLELLKKKISKLKEIKDAEEAKKYISGFLPTQNKINHFSLYDTQGIVISDRKYFRVILDSEDEYICYNCIIKK